jgi:hypothetical protein
MASKNGCLQATMRSFGSLAKLVRTYQLSCDYRNLLHSFSGFGKSVLLSTAIERLQADFGSTDDTLVHYFFCRTGNDTTQLANSVLQNIVYQLYQASASYPRILEQCNNVFEDLEKSNTDEKKPGSQVTSKSSPSVGGKPVEYSALFKKLAGIIGKKIFLVIDALDECSDNVGYLCSELLSIGGADNFSCQMLVSSRPHDTIENAMQSVRYKVLMKEHNGPDIRLKVERGLAHVPGLSSPEERFACDKISEKAEGEFSYVNTAINILMQPWRRSSDG